MKKNWLAALCAVHLSACAVAATPTPAPPLTAAPLTLKSPTTLTLTSSMLSVDEFGDFHCTGELFNNTPQALEIEKLNAAVADRAGQIIASDSAWAVAKQLGTGERTPFRASPLGGLHAVASDYQCWLTIETKNISAPAKIINVVSATYQVDQDGFLHIVGKVVNTSNVEQRVTLIGGVRDSQNRIIDADFLTLTLAPKVETPFDFATLSAVNYHKDLQKTAASVVVR